MDRFSPVAPAHIRVVVVPVGQIDRTRFVDLLGRLRTEAAVVRLGDIRVDGEGIEYLLSPRAFPEGALLFNYTTSPPSEQQQQLAPFELFREPLLVIGVIAGDGDDDEELGSAAAYLRERHPRVVHRQLLILDDAERAPAPPNHDAIRIASAGTSDDSSLRTAMLELARRFLLELTTYTKAMKATPTIPTPGHAWRSNEKMAPLKGNDHRPSSSSGYSTPTQGLELASPVEGESPARPPSRTFGSPPPATSFEQIQAASSVPSAIARSDSRTSNKGKNGNRASSQDRAPSQGFGTSQDKLKQRGKARVGIVVGHILMMSGQWREALSTLAEHSPKARALGETLWWVKCQEGIAVCLLLLAWAGVDFQIPSLCTEKQALALVPGFVAQPADFSMEAGTNKASIRKLSSFLPEYMNRILILYRLNEKPDEMPSFAVSEATVRACKLLSAVYLGHGELGPSALDAMVTGYNGAQKSIAAPSAAHGALKSFIIETLLLYRPEENLEPATRVSILAGNVSVFDMLDLGRKRSQTVLEMFSTMAKGLIQARKVGAAEAGIHPAASLSADTGAQTIQQIVSESDGLKQMMASCYQTFHSDALRREVLEQLEAFVEAQPDPAGVLMLISALLRESTPEGAIDLMAQSVSDSIIMSDAVTGNDQTRLANTISRTIAVSKHIGMAEVEAEYWDSNLLRLIRFFPPEASRVLQCRRSPSATAPTPGNPLLYDPNAKVANAETQQQVLVCDERVHCVILLQNPLDISIDIESLSLAVDHDNVSLDSDFEPITLGPRRLQQVYISVSPSAPGQFNIVGCHIKMAGCRMQLFSIAQQAFSPSASLLAKDLGLLSLGTTDVQSSTNIKLPVTAMPPQPYLVLEDSTFTDISMVEGEVRQVTALVRNTSQTAAHILSSFSTPGVFEPERQPTDAIIPGHGVSSRNLFLSCTAGTSKARVILNYGASSDPSHSRSVKMVPWVTTNPGLQLSNSSVEYVKDGNAFMLSFDVHNAWEKTLSCFVVKDRRNGKTFDLLPGAWRNVRLRMKRGYFDDSGGDPRKREAIREEVLSRLRLEWRELQESSWGGERVGDADMTRLPLTRGMLDAVHGKRLAVTAVYVGERFESPSDDESAVTKDPRIARGGRFVVVRVTVVNRSRFKKSDSLFVRLETHPRRVDLCGERKELVDRLLEEGEATIDFLVSPLGSGQLDLRAVVQPVSCETWHCDDVVSVWVSGL